MTTVYLVDDHAMILPGIRMVVESIEGFTVVGQATDGLTAVKQMQELDPDICIADLSVPMLNGFGITRKLKEVNLKTRVILLTSFSDDSVIEDAVKHQVAGYILKDNNSSELENALINVAKGYKYFTPQIMTRMMEGFNPAKGCEESEDAVTRLSSLTARERDVLALVVEGLSGKEICDKLNISESTMKTHKANLMRKLAARTTKELIILFNKDKLLANKIS